MQTFISVWFITIIFLLLANFAAPHDKSFLSPNMFNQFTKLYLGKKETCV